MPDVMFPHKTIRPGQDKLVKDISEALANHNHILIHAPTGLGKTAASLAPAIDYAIKNKKKVIFVTPRHSQHRIALETIHKMRETSGVQITVADFIGKKDMCIQPGASDLFNNQFYEFCKKHREQRTCNFYVNVFSKKQEPTAEAQLAVADLKKVSPLSVEEVMDHSRQCELCPYEVASLIAKDAQVVIADYYHVLSPSIAENFLRRINASFESSVIIFDEAHHLPIRCRELMSSQLTTFALKRAAKEAWDEGYKDLSHQIQKIEKLLLKYAQGAKDEQLISRELFISDINQITGDIVTFMIQLALTAENIKDEKKRSFLGTLQKFMESWQEQGPGYVRFIKKQMGDRISLCCNCLDPAIVMKPLVDSCSSIIAMSGTLEPLEMYREILGFGKNSKIAAYPSPFSNDQRLTMIIPQTTTKFSQRTPEQFAAIASIVSEISSVVPGNLAVFFPSYDILENILQLLQTKTTKSIFVEQPNLSKAEREELLDRFKKYKDKGAILMGVMGGSFSEGIDLPGDLLIGVLVVGVPLSRPNIETEALIAYYDKLFQKGWDYGYIMPAMTKCLQGAGRCIRTTEDRGIIAFLDARFTWQSYYKCFPKDWAAMVTVKYKEKISEFFKSKLEAKQQTPNFQSGLTFEP